MTQIKICGIKTMPDALAAIDAGADYLGFNFYPGSVRYIKKETCKQIAVVLKREYSGIKLVGVFVNSSLDEVRNILETCFLDLAQLHGDETPEMVSALAGKAYKAFRGIPQRIDGFARESAPMFLVDASVKGSYGGTGVTADWPVAAELAQRYPLLLAGGLTPENVAQAVRQVRPWGVDVASGVEAAPGEKEASKMKAFVQNVEKESKSPDFGKNTTTGAVELQERNE
jgi:phosphoribosylanthranilate isomerase